ncbi:MAG TPA: OmpA family protein [Flavisolibacter sp.]|nr:OmpA family protein [Flavisolibacter sp.]
MAEIDVQPKKRSGSILPWLLLALGVIALVIFLFRNKDHDRNEAATNNTDTSYNNTSTNAAADGWSGLNWNAPAVQYEEVTNRDIEVRGDDRYGIYGLGENILFDKDAATIRSSAEDNLKQIAESINKRYDGGEVRVFGFTDAAGSAGHNQELSRQRAEAVKNWLSQHGKIDAARISLQPEGESNPVASNNTEEGKQQNRRVEIVARKS